MVADLNVWGSLFIEPEQLNALQLTCITVIYAVILYQASNLIASGSEFLLLVPSVAGIVGSIVLPVLGAVPDGVMTLASGVGVPNPQESVGTGIGVLAGSTVMLLTFPWFVAIIWGRVPLKEGSECQPPQSGPEPCYGLADRETYADRNGMNNSGIGLGKSIKKNAVIMLVTTSLYFIIQIPAWSEDTSENPVLTQAKHEKMMCAIGMGASVVFFVGYLIICYRDSKEDTALNAIIAGIQNHQVTLRGALRFAQGGSSDADKNKKRLAHILRPFFLRYDQDKDQTLCIQEFGMLMRDLGEDLCQDEVNKIFRETDADKTQSVSFEEFEKCIGKYLTEPERNEVLQRRRKESMALMQSAIPPTGEDEEEEEEDEMPEEWKELTPEQQMARIIFKASWMMAVGSGIVLFVADPFVDCLTEWGSKRRLNIPSFYISFVVAPFASNASELLSAYSYAVKKTKSSITISVSTLIGAACMNNTFTLGITFGLMYFQNLAWKFTAETVSMVLIQWMIGALAIAKSVNTLANGYMIMACYPLCLFLVVALEQGLGWD